MAPLSSPSIMAPLPIVDWGAPPQQPGVMQRGGGGSAAAFASPTGTVLPLDSPAALYHARHGGVGRRGVNGGGGMAGATIVGPGGFMAAPQTPVGFVGPRLDSWPALGSIPSIPSMAGMNYAGTFNEVDDGTMPPQSPLAITWGHGGLVSAMHGASTAPGSASVVTAAANVAPLYRSRAAAAPASMPVGAAAYGLLGFRSSMSDSNLASIVDHAESLIQLANSLPAMHALPSMPAMPPNHGRPNAVPRERFTREPGVPSGSDVRVPPPSRRTALPPPPARSVIPPMTVGDAVVHHAARVPRTLGQPAGGVGGAGAATGGGGAARGGTSTAAIAITVAGVASTPVTAAAAADAAVDGEGSDARDAGGAAHSDLCVATADAGSGAASRPKLFVPLRAATKLPRVLPPRSCSTSLPALSTSTAGLWHVDVGAGGAPAAVGPLQLMSALAPQQLDAGRASVDASAALGAATGTGIGLLVDSARSRDGVAAAVAAATATLHVPVAASGSDGGDDGSIFRVGSFGDVVPVQRGRAFSMDDRAGAV